MLHVLEGGGELERRKGGGKGETLRGKAIHTRSRAHASQLHAHVHVYALIPNSCPFSTNKVVRMWEDVNYLAEGEAEQTLETIYQVDLKDLGVCGVPRAIAMDADMLVVRVHAVTSTFVCDALLVYICMCARMTVPHTLPLSSKTQVGTKDNMIIGALTLGQSLDRVSVIMESHETDVKAVCTHPLQHEFVTGGYDKMLIAFDAMKVGASVYIE